MPYEDLMNETLLIAYQKIDDLERRGAFLAFLIGISLRLLANHRRKQRTRPASDSPLLLNYADPDDRISRDQDVAFLHQALAMLPAQQREALILFEITGFQVKEIAALHNCSAAAVRQRLVRGRKALAAIIQHQLKVKEGDTL